ncbi:MAG TPA: helix-turn-helix domain-containing protein [Caulobacteraceae bacterium]|jgi:AcrR family transcriptional regulator|nr:helix-turn-helix domain-containing protein [Caulobacteraceae bacterium]
MDTRQRITVAAMELFWEKGFNSTSVADILAHSQVNAGSLYHFFPGKQDVLIGVRGAWSADHPERLFPMSAPRPRVWSAGGKDAPAVDGGISLAPPARLTPYPSIPRRIGLPNAGLARLASPTSAGAAAS